MLSHQLPDISFKAHTPTHYIYLSTPPRTKPTNENHLFNLKTPEIKPIPFFLLFRGVKGHGFRLHEVEKRSMVKCFSLGSVLLLLALAVSMVVLPLFLPPLPPPPLMLLFFPVGIMAALVFLAFSPSEAAVNLAVYAV